MKHNQHQLHQGYARAYSETGRDRDLVYADVNGNRQKQHQSAKSLSVEPDLYETFRSAVNQIEDWFSVKEKPWTETIKAAGLNEPLESEDYCNLLEFALLTALRQKEVIAVFHCICQAFRLVVTG